MIREVVLSVSIASTFASALCDQSIVQISPGTILHCVCTCVSGFYILL